MFVMMAGRQARWHSDGRQRKQIGEDTIALAVALVFGAAAVAQASSSRDDNGGNSGGYHIGPYGQWLGGPAFRPYYWGYHSRGAFAYEPRYRYRRSWRFER